MRTLNPQEESQMKALLAIRQATNPEKKRLEAAIYARKSSDDINQTSLPTQIHDCKAFIKEHSDLLSLTKEHIYQDEAKSGMFTDNRTGFQSLMTDIRNGKIEVVVLYHHDRLSRKVGDFEHIKAELEKLKVFLVFGDVYYENTPMGEFFANLSYSMSQFEARTAASKTAHTLRVQAEKGKSAGGRAPFGLKYVGKQFDIEPTEAYAIKLMFDITEKGGTYADIQTAFALRGITTRSGKAFSYSTISDMLRNWKYAGIYVYCRKDKYGNPVNRKPHRVMLGEQDELRNEETVLNAIVSKKQFLKVQKILEAREQDNPKQNARSEYLLSGLVRCANGLKMYGDSTSGKRGKAVYRYYACTKRESNGGQTVRKISAGILETAVKRIVFREVSTFLRAGKFSADGMSEYIRSIQTDIAYCSRNISERESMNNRLIEREMTADSAMSQLYHEKIKNNLQTINAQKAKIARLQRELKTAEMVSKNPETAKLTEKEVFADEQLTRKLIRVFVREIIVDDKNVNINLYD